MSGAEMVIQALVDQGVQHIFGYPGGAVLPIYDEMFKQEKLKHILVRHEQGAVHAAEGYARSTGKVGCVLVTSGPGATNAVTGLTDALCDSIPLVCITGQVPTHMIGNDAFQECDTTGITRSCTKHNYLVKNIADLARTIHEAFYVARSGRPEQAEVEVEALASLQKTLADAKNLYWARQVGIERMMASGWLARTLGHDDEAVALMQDAARTEESSETHDTLSPGPVGMTAHEALGYLLLELGRPADAFKTFEASLRVSTNRLQSYAGAANAATSVGDLANARFYYGRLVDLAAGSDDARPEIAEAKAFIESSK